MLLFCLQTTAGHIIIRKAKTVTGKIGRRLAHGRRCDADKARGKRSQRGLHTESNIRRTALLILCDGLGGHACGEIASELVAESIAKGFEKQGYYAGFFKDALEQAQKELLEEQVRRDLCNSMKTTAVVLVITPDLIQWRISGTAGCIGFTRMEQNIRERVTIA